MVWEQGKHAVLDAAALPTCQGLWLGHFLSQKCWVFLTTNMFGGTAAILRKDGKNNCSQRFLWRGPPIGSSCEGRPEGNMYF